MKIDEDEIWRALGLPRALTMSFSQLGGIRAERQRWKKIRIANKGIKKSASPRLMPEEA
jgi:hypothetical protein